MKQPILKSLYLLFFCAFALVVTICCREASNAATTTRSSKGITDSLAKDTISIVGVGDIMLGSGYPLKTNLPPDDAINSFDAIAEHLQGDIVFGNLEGVFLNSGKSSKCKDASANCYAFRMPERYAGIFKSAGFNVLSIANNHVGDFDNKGRKRTAEILDSLDFRYAGQKNKPADIFEKDGIKYAFCAFAPNENTVSLLKIDSAKALVSRLKDSADIVIVSFHGGGEGAPYEHVTRQKEIFYKENRGNVYEFAHAVIDAGADVVLGHGPHVTRAVEVYKKKFIAYSLGNFCTYGMFSLRGPNGIAPLLKLKIGRNGDFYSAEVISTKQDKVNRLQTDSTSAAFYKIKALTDADFPGHGLDFSEKGKIRLK